MTKYKDFDEQEMFAPACFPILTEKTEMTKAKSPKERIVNVSVAAIILLVIMQAVIATCFEYSETAGYVAFAATMLFLIPVGLRIRTLQKRMRDDA